MRTPVLFTKEGGIDEREDVFSFQRLSLTPLRRTQEGIATKRRKNSQKKTVDQVACGHPCKRTQLNSPEVMFDQRNPEEPGPLKDIFSFFVHLFEARIPKISKLRRLHLVFVKSFL